MRDLRGKIRQLRELHKKYDRYIFPGALLIGFLIDSFTFNSINLYTSGALLGFYFLLIAVCIYLFHFFDRRQYEQKLGEGRDSFVAVALTWLPVVIQYAFGGLFSAFVVFYLQSASLGISVLFMILLVGVLVGSEIFRERFLRLEFQLSMFFSALFLYLFFALSVVLGEVGDAPFLLSSAISAAMVAFLLLILWPLVSEKFKKIKYSLAASLLGVFVALNGLYIFNFIPPIPLVLKDIGVYHQVERVDNGSYVVESENQLDRDFFSALFSGYDRLVHLVPGEPLYVFTSVYAPDRVGTQIFHEWRAYDERTGNWELTDRIPFEISGGRNEGYRGFTAKENLSPGEWRVDVVTESGAKLGSVSFKIENVETSVVTEQDTL